MSEPDHLVKPTPEPTGPAFQVGEPRMLSSKPGGTGLICVVPLWFVLVDGIPQSFDLRQQAGPMGGAAAPACHCQLLTCVTCAGEASRHQQMQPSCHLL